MDVKPGVRVVRGPDWSWEDQDGGEGNVGTVVEVKDSASEGEESGPGGTTVIVCWDGGVVTNYRCGFGGKYDLRTFDNGQTGVSHPMVTCDGCSTSPVYGMRWKCATCYDYDLCTECYMSNKHSLEHRFLRYDTPRSERVPVPARSGGRRVKAKGLFKGAAVSRGKDWNWGDQDGGIGHTGVVQCIQGWQTESQRSVGKVQWGSSDTSNVYRLGHKGKVDLKCDTPGDGGEYYPDHLPMSGAPPGPPPGTDDAATVGSGDRVKVALDLEVFKTMQEGHGGWNDKMKECLEKTGIVHSVLDSGDVRVVYGERAWTLNPASIVRVSEGHRAIHKPPSTTDTEPSQTSVLPGGNPSSSTARTEATTSMTSSNSSQGGSQRPGTSSMDLQLGFHVYRTGDVVRVLDDLALVHQLQDGHGGWNDDMALSLGQLGRVMNVFGSGDCRVKVNGYMWTLNPKALVPAPGESPPDVPDQMRSDLDMGLHMRLLSMLGHSATAVTAAAAGDIETLKNFLSKKPEAVDETIGDKTALQVAAGNGNLEIARILLQYKASVNVQDEDGDRPLHVCAFNSSTDVAELLLQHGANPNLKNHRGMTALLIATARGNIRMVKAMLGAREVDPSIQDGDGDTALHLACRERNVEAAKLLLDAGADPAITNNDSFNCLHSAAMTGIERVCELIVKKYPRLLNIRKDDGFGPLHLASFNGNFSVAKALLQFDKCDIDAVCGDGRTALHLAVDKGSADIVEVLVGHGIDLSILDTSGLTALHLAVGKLSIIGITDNSPELSKICSTLSDLPSAMVGSAAVACLLVREGADLYCKGNVDITPLDICTEELVAHLTKFVKERATFHGSLRKSPKPTPADLVEEKDTHTSPRKAEKPQRQTAQGVESKLVSKLKVAEKSEDQGRVLGRKGDATIVKTTPTDTPTTASPDSHIPKTVSPVLPDDDEACLLCDRPVDVRIEPCGHTVLCRSHANTAKRCPQCRGPIHSIADLEPLCGMCQENVCSVTLKPCDHMMCSACALLMKRCFECKTKITSKIGLDEATAVKSESDPTSITTTDSSVSISDESILCEICVSNKKNTAFTCGHQLCYDCSLKVDKCPICREEIKHRIKLH